jgi:hypothetical protein
VCIISCHSCYILSKINTILSSASLQETLKTHAEKLEKTLAPYVDAPTGVAILVSDRRMMLSSVDGMASESGVVLDLGFFTIMLLLVCVFLEMQLNLLHRSKMTTWSF